MNCSRRPAKQVCETAGCRVTLLRCGLIDATLSGLRPFFARTVVNGPCACRVCIGLWCSL
jgi:hypothetical protein